jgi:hypothetical protein
MSAFRCKIILTEKRKMIATLIAIQDATKNAVMDRKSVSLAHDLWENKDYMDERQFAHAIFSYSAHLTSLTATLVLDATLTKSQIGEMMDTMKEMDSMGKDTTNE